MNEHQKKYWHIQMYKPYGQEDEARVDSKKMLEREEPIIGIGERGNNQCENFKYKIKNGDIVLVREGNEAIALCKIISENFTDRELTDEFLHKNFRRVKILAWAKDYKQPSNSRLFTQGAFSSCGDWTEQYEYINNWLKHIENMEFTNKCERLLECKRNIIIQGAPGTGKTYNTASIALKVLGVTDIDLTDHETVIKRYKELTGKRIFFTTFHQSLDYEDFVEGLKPHVLTNEQEESVGVTYKLENGIFKRACQAVTEDESKDITECINDYLHHKINGFENKRVIPTITGKSSFYAWWEEGNTTIKCRSTHSTITHDETHSPSPLNIEKVKLQAIGEGMENNWPAYAKAFIEAVKEEYNIHGNNKVVLIIDEINRGNVAKIFGELITLLEVDKREGSEHPIQVTLPYSKELFSVPKNLYIIGTMNTTDRSTGTIDYALRRRFAFVTLKSDKSVIEKHYNTKPTLKSQALALFKNIKEFIRKKQCGDLGIDDLMVGHSYFMSDSEEELKDKMEYEVLPLIAEYINDGILNVSSKEKEAAFEAWCDLQLATIEEVNEEEEQEEE